MSMRSFIRAAEVWLPSSDGTALVFGEGLYGDLAAFAQTSRGLSFRRGEGLPGEAWALRHPVVIKSLKDSSFRRIEAAAEAGLTSGIAMPIFSGDAVRAVVVFLCGDDARHVGAIEVWKHDPDADAQIGLDDGYYGAAELFETVSRLKRFGRGFGLPGSVWASDMPMVFREIYRSERFLRHEEALQVGLSLGLGLPCNYDPGRIWVMLFLSALGTPLAGRFEIWIPDADGTGLVYEAGLSEEDDSPRPRLIGPEAGLLGRVLATGLPAITANCSADAPWLVGPAERGVGHAAIAIPTLSGHGELKAVTAWRF
ncbi:GAF domain-containing protein [Methylobacterium durans]|uniref:GAF domain-containing protein n=1 Tax=Methylobacterium durans TaxID=2202825 RepID=UPI002AFE419E|nr:GAF domain-containing protein [Methylobacterium durans]MEA1831822.1 GAF domain-containing protein [Methylobacterium durans]